MIDPYNPYNPNALRDQLVASSKASPKQVQDYAMGQLGLQTPEARIAGMVGQNSPAATRQLIREQLTNVPEPTRLQRGAYTLRQFLKNNQADLIRGGVGAAGGGGLGYMLGGWKGALAGGLAGGVAYPLIAQALQSRGLFKGASEESNDKAENPYKAGRERRANRKESGKPRQRVSYATRLKEQLGQLPSVSMPAFKDSQMLPADKSIFSGLGKSKDGAATSANAERALKDAEAALTKGKMLNARMAGMRAGQLAREYTPEIIGAAAGGLAGGGLGYSLGGWGGAAAGTILGGGGAGILANYLKQKGILKQNSAEDYKEFNDYRLREAESDRTASRENETLMSKLGYPLMPVFAPLETVGGLHGLLSNATASNRSPIMSALPGVAASKFMRRRRERDRILSEGQRDRSAILHEKLGGLASTLGLSALGGIAGAAARAYRNKRDNIGGNEAALGLLSGAGIGALAGAGAGVASQTLGAILGLARASKEAKRAEYLKGSMAGNWLIPGQASYNSMQGVKDVYKNG